MPDFHPDYENFDVFIAGSGPIGATYAKKCVDAGLRVLMVEIGAADSLTSKPVKGPTDPGYGRSVQFRPGYVAVPGYHKKNQIEYQKDIDRFVNVIKGALSTVSIPTSNLAIPTLDPASFQNSENKPFISLGRNPVQDPFDNLGAEAVTRGVGGMTTHWTCATPEFHPTIERPILDANPSVNESLWKYLYKEAKDLIGTSEKEFDRSIRHTLVLKTLQQAYEGSRIFKPLPLACHRLSDPDYVEWHATDRILEELFTDPRKRQLFTLLTNHRCTRVIIEPFPGETHNIAAAELTSLLPNMETNPSFHGSTFYVRARAYVIAAGAILANSQRVIPTPYTDGKPDTNPIPTPLTPNLGKYITEQPMTFCQVVLDADLINSIDDNPYNLDWWKRKVDEHKKTNPKDPIHIPFRDPEPQVTSPFTAEHPWHTQIHRDAFSYGAVAENIDTRLIVDFRFFGYVEPREQNQLLFQESYEDAYGMPQPTFHFQMSADDRRRARSMMDDMCRVALKLGGYLPGSEPQFMTPGLALHLAGTVRAGLDKKETVADTYSKVWDFPNLYVGGNGVIPTGFGANPTLTSLCYAIRGADNIIRELEERNSLSG